MQMNPKKCQEIETDLWLETTKNMKEVLNLSFFDATEDESWDYVDLELSAISGKVHF